MAVVLIEDGEILLARRRAPSFHGMWCIPCGHVAEGETLEEAARREFFEETGLDVTIGDVLFAHLSFQLPERPVLGVWFVGSRAGGQLVADSDASEVRFFPIAQPPPELAFTGDRLLIEKLQLE